MSKISNDECKDVIQPNDIVTKVFHQKASISTTYCLTPTTELNNVTAIICSSDQPIRIQFLRAKSTTDDTTTNDTTTDDTATAQQTTVTNSITKTKSELKEMDKILNTTAVAARKKEAGDAKLKAAGLAAAKRNSK